MMMKSRKNFDSSEYNIIRFYLALVRPNVELFEGTITTEEYVSGFNIKIEYLIKLKAL